MALTPYIGEEVDAPQLTPYAGPEAAPAATPSRLRRFVADPLISATKGAIGLPEAAVGVADIATGGLAGKAAEAVGFRPKQAKEILNSLYSPEQQAANNEVAQAEGVLPTLKASFRNPSTIAHTVIESAPSMLGGAGVARGLLRAGVTASPLIAAAAGEGAMSAGSTAEQVRQEDPAGRLSLRQSAIAAGSGALTSALGVAGGKLANKLGIVDVDVALAGGARATRKGTAKALAEGVVSEGLLEEAPQSAQEQAAQNAATGKPLGEGVAKAATVGAIAGGVMGGGTSAAFNLAAKAVGIGDKTEQIKAEIETLQDLVDPEEQKAAVADLGARVSPENPAAFEAQVLDRLDAGDHPLDEKGQEALEVPEAKPEETRASLLEAVAESLAVDENPLEILQAKDEAKVLDALKPAEPAVQQDLFAPATPVADPSVLRAQTWAKDGRVILKEGLAPDAEVAALLDDMGLTLVKGERVDRKDGGSVKRREWRVEPKAQGEAPIAHMEQRLAYPDNPNLVVARKGDQIALIDLKSKSVLGKADIVEGKLGGWSEGSEPATPAERVQIEGLFRRHLGEGRSESEAVTRFSRTAAPKKTVKAYKLFRTLKNRPGELFPLFIGKTDAVKVGEWVEAEHIPTKGFAPRPGWHAGANPSAPHLRSAGKIAPDRVWAEIEMPDDVDWQTVADGNKSAKKSRGDIQDQVPKGGHYAFNTSKKGSDGTQNPAWAWLIGGAIKINRILSNDEVADILTKAGMTSEVEAETQGNEALFGQFKEKLNRSGGAGLPAPEIRTHLASAVASLKIPVVVVGTAAEIPGLRPDAPAFNGVFHRGTIYLNAEHITSLKEAEDVLLRHEIQHAGLRALLGIDGLDKVLAKAWNDLGSGVREFAQEKGIETRSKEGKREATEEYIVELARADAKHPLWDRFVEVFKAVLRKMGIDLKYSDAELRSLVARAGEAMRTKGVESDATRFSADGVPLTWFSSLEKLIDQKTKTLKGDNKVPASHFTGILKEAKKDELEQTGLTSFLKENPRVTKNEVIDFLKEKQLDLRDVVLGDGPKVPKITAVKVSEASDVPQWAIDNTPDAWAVYRDGEFMYTSEEASKYDAIAEYDVNADDDYDQENEPQFAQYVEPGAAESSYREMFVTAPSTQDPYTGDIQAINDYHMGIITKSEAEARGAVINEPWEDGHSQYQGVENPIVRIRFNERSVDGKRVLFVEEMQGPSDANQKKMPEYLRKRIYDLGVKRVLAYAKENGFAGVAWTTGEMQAKRYDLSKQISKVTYTDNASSGIGRANLDGDPTYGRVVAFDHNGGKVIDKQVEPEELPEIVGKDVAKKLLAQAPEHSNSYGLGVRLKTLSGLDLKVGGEGLAALYDRTLPSLFKKYGGEGVGTVKIDGIPGGARQMEDVMERAEDPDFRMIPVPFTLITDRTPGSFPLYQRLNTKEGVNDLYQKTTTQIAKRALSDISGNVWRSIMPVDRAIKMAQSMPIYAPIKDLLADYLVQKRAKAAAGDVPTTRAQTIRLEHEKAFKTDTDLAAFNDLTIKATLYELHADGRDAGWTPKSWEESGKAEQTGKTLGEARTEIAALWKKLSPEQRKVQQKIIDHMKVLADQFRDAQLEPLRASFGNEAFNQAEEIAGTLWKQDPAGMVKLRATHGNEAVDLALQIAQISDRGQLRGDYAPLMRFGDHVVRTLEEGSEKRLKTEMFESKQAAMDAVERIKKMKGVTAQYELQTEGSRNVTNIPLAFLERMKAAAEARGLTGEALDSLMDDFKAARLQTMPRYAVSGHTLKREGVEGYSTDALRAYATYTAKAARAIASLKYGTAIEQTFRDMTNRIKAQDTDVHAIERMSTLRDNLYRLEMAHNAEKINEFTKAVGKATFLWYLSSPSVWAVQWAQPFMTTIPKMAARYGFTKAFTSYVKEAKNYTAGRFSDEKIEAFNLAHENAGERLYEMIQAERKASAAEKGRLRLAMKALYGSFSESDRKLLILKVLGLQGMLDLSSSHELQDLITGASRGEKLVDAVVSKGAFFMQKSETGSRRAAAISSFQIALAHGKDFMEANDYAANIIDDTLADFSSQNRPELLRGNTGRVLGQFQFFRLHMLGKTVQLAKDAYLEDGWGERRKELAYMVGMSMGLAGASGTPIAMLASNAVTGAIWAGLAAAFGDPDDPWDPKQDFENAVREALGDTAGNVFLKGLPSLIGADISKRVGLGGMANVINGEPPPGLTGTQKAQWYAGRALGPAFGIVSDSLRASDALADGDLGEAVAVSSPKVLKDFIKAYGLSERGAVGGGGNTMIQPEDLSPTSVALQLLGVNPLEVSLAQEERREISALSVELRQRRSLLMKRVTEATMEGDMEARDEAIEAVNTWGMKQPGMKISQGELLAALKRGQAARAGVLTKRDQMLQERVRGGE